MFSLRHARPSRPRRLVASAALLLGLSGGLSATWARAPVDPLTCMALGEELKRVEVEYKKQLAFEAVWKDEMTTLKALAKRLGDDASWAGSDAWAIVEGVEQLADLSLSMTSLLCEVPSLGKRSPACLIGDVYDELKLRLLVVKEPDQAVERVLTSRVKKLVSLLADRAKVKELYESSVALWDAAQSMKAMAKNEQSRRELRTITKRHLDVISARLAHLMKQTVASHEVQAALQEIHKDLQRLIRESKCAP